MELSQVQFCPGETYFVSGKMRNEDKEQNIQQVVKCVNYVIYKKNSMQVRESKVHQLLGCSRLSFVLLLGGGELNISDTFQWGHYVLILRQPLDDVG